MVFDVIEQLTTPAKISLLAGISIAIDGADSRERLLAQCQHRQTGSAKYTPNPRDGHADSSFLMNPTV